MFTIERDGDELVLECGQAQGEAPPFLLGKFSDGVINITFLVFTYM